MNPTSRLIVNTLAQNIRTVVNICLSLYSTRLILDVMGQSDYGIYMLVAGVVSFLSYFINAMITTTLRHLSYSHGQNNAERTRMIFANSYLINFFLGIFLVLVLVSMISWLFNGTTLNIPLDKCEEAKWVYLLVLSSVFFTFVTSPFKALLTSHENIVYISVIETLDGILKVVLVFSLYLFDSHRLVVYSCIISSVMLFNFLAFAIYAKLHYEESCLIPNPKKWDMGIQKDLLGFTTWTIYGFLCTFLRTQGIAVVLNRAYGTFINASYGIAGQVLGSVSFLSTAVLNAFMPQIIQAEGAGNRQHMLSLCLNACKYSYLLLVIVAVPIIFEMDNILQIWLADVPQYTSLFCRMFLVSALMDQLTSSLNAANQALGKIRNYSLLIYTTKILTVPFVWLALEEHGDMQSVLYIYMLFEFVSAMMRLPYISRTTGLDLQEYVKSVLMRIFVPTLIAVLVSFAMVSFVTLNFRFLATMFVCAVFTVFSIWSFSLNSSEQEYVKSKINGIRKV